MSRYKVIREAWNEKTFNGYSDNPYWRISFDENDFMVSDNGEITNISNHSNTHEPTPSEIIRIKEIVKECNINIPNLFTDKFISEAKSNHEKLREVLQKYGNPEFGDCIIDEICFIFGYATTIDVEPEQE